MNIDELAKYAGEEHFMKAPKLTFTDMGLDGRTGEFFTNVKVGDKWAKKPLENDKLELVILRIRRKLSAWDDATETIISSSEHNTPSEIIPLWKGKKKIDSGTGYELRERHKELKTQHLVYCLYDNKDLIRLTVKGSSLGDKEKIKDIYGFYDYLNSFSRDKGEHIWMFKTSINKKLGKKGATVFYSMTFTKGEKLEEPMMLEVADKLKMLHTAFSASSLEAIKESKKEIDETPVIDLDSDKTDEIPF